MSKQKIWIWIGGLVLLCLAGLLAAVLGFLGLLPWQAGSVYQDPLRRYTIEIDPRWEQVAADGPYAQFHIPDPPLKVYILVIEAGTVDAAFSEAVAALGFDPRLLQGGSVAIFGDWQAYANEGPDGLNYGLAGQVVGANAYVLAAKAEKPGVGIENASLMRALTSFKIAGKQEVVIEDYAGVEAMVQAQVDRLAGSISVAVVDQGGVVYTYAYGQANPAAGIAADAQTIYRFGSMTKPFTATALMQLVEQGKVDLDAWPGEYVPEFPRHWDVTVRQLLNHSACLPDHQRLTDGLIAMQGETFDSLEAVFSDYVKAFPDLACAPGKEAQYSNPHYLALGRIIEEVSGQPYDTYVVDHILVPLHMESTHFQFITAGERYAKGQYPAARTDQLIAQLNAYRGPGQEALILHRGEAFTTLNDFRILPPWGGLLGPPADVAQFLRMHLNDGRVGNTQILQPETVAAMQAMQAADDGSPLGMGLSWWIGEDDYGTYYYHGGGGHTIETTMRFYPDLGLGVVVMSSVNGSQADKIAAVLVSAWAHEK